MHKCIPYEFAMMVAWLFYHRTGRKVNFISGFPVLLPCQMYSPGIIM
ncbi:MAG: hypothetical protein J6W31_02610 [Clostridia bacterium]|nr:hypothetical protein [Clostridia bacterium]